MNYNEVEEKRNQLNIEIRSLLAVIDLIDGNTKNYEDYVINSLDESSFLSQQIILVKDAKNRMVSIFK